MKIDESVKICEKLGIEPRCRAPQHPIIKSSSAGEVGGRGCSLKNYIKNKCTTNFRSSSYYFKAHTLKVWQFEKYACRQSHRCRSHKFFKKMNMESMCLKKREMDMLVFHFNQRNPCPQHPPTTYSARSRRLALENPTISPSAEQNRRPQLTTLRGREVYHQWFRSLCMPQKRASPKTPTKAIENCQRDQYRSTFQGNDD